MTAEYDGKIVLNDISLDVFERDFLGITGPNGGGKTTLLKVILGLLKPVKGSIRFSKESLKDTIGYMPQTNQIDKKFPILVSEVIGSGLISEKKMSGKERKIRLYSVIDEMDLTSIRRCPVGELSGGQLQRTLLARAIINEPELLILDEPGSYIDKRSETHFYDLLRRINEKTAIILVSHDVGTLISTVKNIACVNRNLHYHPGSDVDSGWLEQHFDCLFDRVGYGCSSGVSEVSRKN